MVAIYNLMTENVVIHKTTGVRQVGCGCFLPNEAWHNLNNVELRSLLSKDFLGFKKGIAIFDTDYYIRELFWEQIITRVMGLEYDDRNEMMKNYTNIVIEKLYKYSNIDIEKFRSHDLVFNPPYRGSTAYNYEDGKAIGLHIDAHEPLSFSNRAQGFQLLNINIGKSNRYFYFIPYYTLEIIDQIIQHPSYIGDGSFQSVKDVKNQFLNLYPNIEVYRITLKPGQAYITVSQNIIHDGGTNRNGDKDICFMISGSFSKRRRVK